ncbi:MAG TPA: DUF3606 domain-containing protein [Rubrivivax sp.]
MQDTPFKPLDPGRIHALDPQEFQYWCKELKCTEKQLMDTIAKVGDHVTEVRQSLTETQPRR